MIEDSLSETVIGACMEVHAQLGAGLFESVYEECLCHELRLRGIAFARQVVVPVTFKGLTLDVAFRIDLVVEDRLIVELKSVDQILPVHNCQLRTYLRLTQFPVGLIVNFNVAHLRNGLRRLESTSMNSSLCTPRPPPSP